MKAPSFFIETEDATKMMLQYRFVILLSVALAHCHNDDCIYGDVWISDFLVIFRTRRRGFHYYVQGQVLLKT